MNQQPKKVSVAAAVILALLCTVLASALTWGTALKTMRQNDYANPIDDILIYDTEQHTEAEETEADNIPEAEDPTAEGNILSVSRDNTAVMTASSIYEANIPSIVGITSVGKTTNIFGQTTATASSGTGFVIREDGYILTNYHVIEGGGELTVSFYDGKTYPAEVVGYENEQSDLAVLKIEAAGLIPVTLGSSEDLKVGEDITVIGNPLGELTFSLSRGVVSALGRRINTDGTPITMLQIDAAVNSGNSGGPAFGPDGKVVGVVTAKYAAESIEGLGFCIPAEDVAAIASDLIAYGYVKGRASLGLACEDAYEVYSYYYRYYGKRIDSLKGLLKEGVYVGEILSDSPASQVNLERGDYITAVNEQAVSDCAALQEILSNNKPGDTLTLTISRDGVLHEVIVTLDEYNPLTYGALSSGTAV